MDLACDLGGRSSGVRCRRCNPSSGRSAGGRSGWSSGAPAPTESVTRLTRSRSSRSARSASCTQYRRLHSRVRRTARRRHRAEAVRVPDCAASTTSGRVPAGSWCAWAGGCLGETTASCRCDQRRPVWASGKERGCAQDRTDFRAGRGLFLIGRAVAEVFLIDVKDSASYRGDWGGPSLLGLLVVHCGPGSWPLSRLAPE